MAHRNDRPPSKPRESPRRFSAIVLVVDDYDDLRRAVATLLTGCGYRVVEARNGKEALARLCEHVPDLVVLDLEMPVMDGWQFRSEQRRLADRQLAAIPVLLFTAADPALGVVAALRAVGLVQKPFEPETFLGAVEQALAS